MKKGALLRSYLAADRHDPVNHKKSNPEFYAERKVHWTRWRSDRIAVDQCLLKNFNSYDCLQLKVIEISRKSNFTQLNHNNKKKTFPLLDQLTIIDHHNNLLNKFAYENMLIAVSSFLMWLFNNMHLKKNLHKRQVRQLTCSRTINVEDCLLTWASEWKRLRQRSCQ